MALTKCSECGNEVSSLAASCPKCGAPVARGHASPSSKPQSDWTRPMKGSEALAALVVAGLGIWAFTHFTFSDDENSASQTNSPRVAAVAAAPAPAVPQPPMDVTAKQLFLDYQLNEVAADMRYKGKILHVAGSVDAVQKDILGAPYLSLDTGDSFAPVHATFPKGSEEQLAKFHIGDNLVVTCVGHGMIMKSPIVDCTR